MKADGKSKASDLTAPATTSKDMKNPTAETKSPADGKTTAGEMKPDSKAKASESTTSKDLKTPTAETKPSTSDSKTVGNAATSATAGTRRKAHSDHVRDQARESRRSYKREFQSLNRDGGPGWCPLSSDAAPYRGNLSGMARIRFHPCARQVLRSSTAHPRDRFHHRRLNELAASYKTTRAA